MKLDTEIDTALEAVLITTTAKTVEPFNDQYTNTQTEHAKAYPAVYPEVMDPVTYSQGGNAYQQARMRVRFHCVVHDIKTTKAAINTFAQEVFMKLHQLKLYDTVGRELTSEMVRIVSNKPKRYSNLKVLTIDFEFEAYDYSTLPTNLSGPVNFNIVVPQP